MTHPTHPQNVFIGRYVSELLNVLTASAVSGANALVISPPGFGKTEIMRAAAHSVSDGQWNFTALAPSSPPSLIEGIYNPREFLQGNLQRLVKGTASDPQNRVIVLDELFRASDPVFDSLLHVLDRKDVEAHVRPTVWATSNFAITDERSEALRDRIALWVHLYPVVSDLHGMLGAFSAAFQNGLELALPQSLPTWDEITAIRALHPGAKAHKALAGFLEAVCKEIAQPPNPTQTNPRHLRQWYTVLFRYNAYLTGSDNFGDVGDAAKAMLRYLWVQPTRQDWETWGRKTAGVVDLTGSIIQGLLQHTALELNKLLEGQGKGGASDNQGLVMKATALIQATQKELAERAGDDKRVKEAHVRLQTMIMTVVKGEKVGLDL